MAATIPCCKCNGSTAKCKRCDCVKKKRPCTNCLPLRNGYCCNTVLLRQSCQKKTSSSQDSSHDTHMDSPAPFSIPILSSPIPNSPSQSSSLSPNPCPPASHTSPTQTAIPPSDNPPRPNTTVDIGHLLSRAFGQGASMSTGVGVTDGCWYKRWLSIVSLSGSHYHLPGGSVGRKYVDQLTHELSHFSAGNYPSERFIIFSSVVLQRDRSVVKGADIRRVIERRLIMWDKGDFDLLVQEAERCDRSLRPRTKFNHDKTHTATVFTRLMLQGKVKAAVRWLSDNTKGRSFVPMTRYQ